MQQAAVAIVLASAVLHAFWNLLAKKAANKVAFLFLVIVSSRVVFFPFFAATFSWDALKHLSVSFFIMAGVFYTLYVWFLGKTYEAGDMSLTYPVLRSYPLLTAVPAYLIWGETVSAAALFGITLMVLGLFTINLKGTSISFSSLNFKAKPLGYAFLTALSSVGYSVFDRLNVDLIDPLVFFYLLGMPMIPLLAPMVLRDAGSAAVARELKLNLKTVAAASALMFISYYMILYSFTLTNLVYIISLRQISIVFGVLLGALVLRERYSKIRFFASSLIFAGAYLISVSN